MEIINMARVGFGSVHRQYRNGHGWVSFFGSACECLGKFTALTHLAFDFDIHITKDYIDAYVICTHMHIHRHIQMKL